MSLAVRRLGQHMQRFIFPSLIFPGCNGCERSLKMIDATGVHPNGFFNDSMFILKQGNDFEPEVSQLGLLRMWRSLRSHRYPNLVVINARLQRKEITLPVTKRKFVGCQSSPATTWLVIHSLPANQFCATPKSRTSLTLVNDGSRHV